MAASTSTVHATSARYVGRFAPTPSGPLHAGSLLAAVISWLDARGADGRWHLRIDDIDGPRVRPGAADSILRTLEAFGLVWDGPVTWQSQRTPAYQAVLDALVARDQAFPCGCSRKEITAAGRPGWEGPIYPGTCRRGLPGAREPRALRARASTRYWEIDDAFLGPVAFDLEALGSDFVIRRADGIVAYQLATVADDVDLGVTRIVRGIDLLGSTPRQLQLYQALGHPAPSYAHHPVLATPGGAKLAKATGAAAIQADSARRELADSLARIGLAPSDARAPAAPAAQLAEALTRLAGPTPGLAAYLPPTTTLPAG